MSNDKMRAEFEDYMRLLDVPTKRDSDKYTDKLVSSYWLLWSYAWQKSRAAQVVELPVSVCRTHVFEIPWTSEVGMEHDEYYEIEDVKSALDAAGVAYK